MVNTLNLSVEGVRGEELLMACDLEGLSLSSGSACMVGSLQPSHVLLAMGVSKELAQSTLRFSISQSTLKIGISEIVVRLQRAIQNLRSQ